jgi:hypothetical protein
MLRFVTFHTSGDGGGGYEEEVPEWKASLLAHGYDDLVVVDVGTIKEWRAATMEKARVCLEAYEALPPETDLVWIDVDARVRGRLSLFEKWVTEGDIGYRLWPHNENFPDGEVLSGTLFFPRDNDTTWALLKLWAGAVRPASARKGEFAGVHGDQNVLAGCMDKLAGLDRFFLPAPYTWIFDFDVRFKTPGPPLIEHFQASRRRSRKRGFRGFVRMEDE